MPGQEPPGWGEGWGVIPMYGVGPGDPDPWEGEMQRPLVAMLPGMQDPYENYPGARPMLAVPPGMPDPYEGWMTRPMMGYLPGTDPWNDLPPWIPRPMSAGINGDLWEHLPPDVVRPMGGGMPPGGFGERSTLPAYPGTAQGVGSAYAGMLVVGGGGVGRIGGGANGPAQITADGRERYSPWRRGRKGRIALPDRPETLRQRALRGQLVGGEGSTNQGNGLDNRRNNHGGNRNVRMPRTFSSTQAGLFQKDDGTWDFSDPLAWGLLGDNAADFIIENQAEIIDTGLLILATITPVPFDDAFVWGRIASRLRVSIANGLGRLAGWLYTPIMRALKLNPLRGTHLALRIRRMLTNPRDWEHNIHEIWEVFAHEGRVYWSYGYQDGVLIWQKHVRLPAVIRGLEGTIHWDIDVLIQQVWHRKFHY